MHMARVQMAASVTQVLFENSKVSTSAHQQLQQLWETKSKCWCTVWRQGGVYFLLLILLMMLILLCLKCHWCVSCSIPKALQFISAFSAKIPAKAFASSLSKSPLWLEQLELPHIHSFGHITPSGTHSSTAPNANSVFSLSKTFTTQSCPIPVPGICYPSTKTSFVDCSLHFCFSTLCFPFMTGDKNLQWNQWSPYCKLLYNVSVMYHIALKHQLITARQRMVRLQVC